MKIDVLKEIQKKYYGGGNKYLNKRTVYNGRNYHSKKEAEYAQELDLLIKAKIVEKWEPQVKIPITVNGEKICDYILDFLIHYTNGKKEYVDVKGLKKGAAYQYFVIKKKLIKAIHKIEIKEV